MEEPYSYNYVRRSNATRKRKKSTRRKTSKRDSMSTRYNTTRTNKIPKNYSSIKRKKSSTRNNANRRPYSSKHKAKHSNNRYKKRKLNKKKVFFVIILPIIIIFFIINKSKTNDHNIIQQTNSNISSQNEQQSSNDIQESSENSNQNEQQEPNKIQENNNNSNQNEQQEPNEPKENNINSNQNEETNTNVEITDWKIRLANYDNLLPEDFEVELADIDSSRQFDARAIKYLKDMINDMKKAGNTNIWVQSAYRSVKRQKELYDNSINKYLKQGKTQEEAERLTLEYINKPGGSDHNLGLAVDFNYVNNTFEDTKEYKWLMKNAENYGFVLRYPKDKEDITKIAYESWHWRYVGEEHAKRMNELNMCLEEYVEYLENGNR